jgi:hypothetical protein
MSHRQTQQWAHEETEAAVILQGYDTHDVCSDWRLMHTTTHKSGYNLAASVPIKFISVQNMIGLLNLSSFLLHP